MADRCAACERGDRDTHSQHIQRGKVADAPRPADPLTEEEIAALDLFIAARESVDPDVARDYIERGRAALDATRAPRSEHGLCCECFDGPDNTAAGHEHWGDDR